MTSITIIISSIIIGNNNHAMFLAMNASNADANIATITNMIIAGSIRTRLGSLQHIVCIYLSLSIYIYIYTCTVCVYTYICMYVYQEYMGTMQRWHQFVTENERRAEAYTNTNTNTSTNTILDYTRLSHTIIYYTMLYYTIRY